MKKPSEWDEVLTESETEDAEMYLEFYSELEEDYSDAELAAEESLEEYTLEEIFDLNEIEDTEVLALLYQGGIIGLPTMVEDEEVEDVPDEEEDL